MTYEDFIAKLNNLTPDGRFSFGFNWLDYVKHRVTDQVIEKHYNDLNSIYQDIPNRGGVIDIGSGSGLSSLCFQKLGFDVVHSIDLDPYSIEAANELMIKYGNRLSNSIWDIKQQSILDTDFINQRKGIYDVVYSWGVLHHTGNMWQPIKNAAAMVKHDGYLHLALYVNGDRYTDHLAMKFQYHFLDIEGKKKMLYDYLNQIFFQYGADVFTPNDTRGMNAFNDAMDWLGGLPYETCDPEVLDTYLWSLGFRRMYYQNANSQGGNFTSIFKRQ